jgi:hypothetical protein
VVDVVLGVVDTRVRARQSVTSNRAVSSLMGALLGDGDDN